MTDRRIAYTSAAIKGILAAEHCDIELTSYYVSSRAKEIADFLLALEDGEEPPEQLYGAASDVEREHIMKPMLDEADPEPEPESANLESLDE